MNLRCPKALWLAALLVFALSVSGFAQCGHPNELYCQPWDGGSNLFASQNDTISFGNFATVYDNFTLSSSEDIESLHWVGGYFNPPQQGPITAWTATFWTNNAGQPGTAITAINQAGTANETFISNVNGFPIYSYDMSFASVNLSPGEYWVSVVPDLGFPPQWGWASGTGGDGIAWQDFSGVRTQLAFDMAFAIDGHGVSTTPEPGTLVMLGTGILGLAGTIRRKLS